MRNVMDPVGNDAAAALLDQKPGLTRESSDTIGFVLACLFSSAIDKGDLREWCFKVIGELDVGDAPGYLFDLADSDGNPIDIYRAIGFVPTWKHSKIDGSALFGIALRRGNVRHEWPVTHAQALKALLRRPSIENRFRATFPFIEMETSDESKGPENQRAGAD